MSAGEPVAPFAPDLARNLDDKPAISLAAVLERIQPVLVRGDAESIAVRDVQFDHRQVRSGDLFCCLTGGSRDGHDFAGEAVANGAVALLCERLLDGPGMTVPQVVVPPEGSRTAMAEAACAVQGDPASHLMTAGVTGTNGKTTTTFLLKAILESAGLPTTVIGTLGGARTTPEAPDLQRRLAEAVEKEDRAVALEVTSHALVQHRVDGFTHDAAGFTNLSQDHLDYHHTMEEYFAAKMLLFTPDHARAGVVNADDPYGRRLLESSPIPVEPFSIDDAEDLDITFAGSRFGLAGHEVRLRLTGEPNVRNALAAAGMARLLGVDDATIASGLSEAQAVRGRFEPIDNDLGLAAIIDYAHTPAALAESLPAMRLLAAGGRLVVVFGAGGDRDAEKRPLMGHETTTAADVVVVTSDNPRHEEPAAIIGDILRGCDGPAELHVEEDRRQAIALALELAKPGDLVVVAGKGHETTQQIGDEMQPFDDREVLRQQASALAGRR